MEFKDDVEKINTKLVKILGPKLHRSCWQSKNFSYCGNEIFIYSEKLFLQVAPPNYRTDYAIPQHWLKYIISITADTEKHLFYLPKKELKLEYPYNHELHGISYFIEYYIPSSKDKFVNPVFSYAKLSFAYNNLLMYLQLLFIVEMFNSTTDLALKFTDESEFDTYSPWFYDMNFLDGRQSLNTIWRQCYVFIENDFIVVNFCNEHHYFRSAPVAISHTFGLRYEIYYSRWDEKKWNFEYAKVRR